MATLKRQHTITLTRLTKLEERLQTSPTEEPKPFWQRLWPFQTGDLKDAG